jgi:predicted Zn finger-like uncharacterized protein
MIITCPECDTQYLLPDDSVGRNGRKVKCTECAYIWTQRPEIIQEKIQEYTPELQQDFPEDTPIMDAEEFAREVDLIDPFKARREPIFAPAPVTNDAPFKDLLVKTLGLAMVFLLVLLGGAVAIRFTAISWWPPVAMLYDSLGIPAPAPGANLALKDVKAIINGNKLEVSGMLDNPTPAVQFMPILRIRLNGEKGVLKDWDINLYGKSLPAGKGAGFQYSLQDAPAAGQNVTLFFVD